jgi:membrane fusion protein (multidrug efflux system)
MKIFHLLMVLFLPLFACHKKEQAKVIQKQEERALEISTIIVRAEEINLSSELFGRTLSTHVSEIRPQVSGIIFKRFFHEGSFIKKGEQLFQIDPARYHVAFQRAKGSFEEAKATLYSKQTLMKRYENLIKVNAISKQEYDDAVSSLKESKAKVIIAEAEMNNAKINVEYTKVFAPISGYIGRTLVTEGALVNANQAEPLAVIRSLDPLYVDLTFPGAEALDLRMRLGQYLSQDKEGQGLTVTFKLEGVEEPYKYKGRIEARELAINEETGSLNIRAEVSNPDLLLLPGMYVRGYVDQLGYGKKLAVPQSVIHRDKNGDAQVWIVGKDHKLERRRVETGVMYGTKWIIENGVTEGEMIAADNFTKLQPGMSVDTEKGP